MQQEQLAVVKITVRQRETLAIMRAREDLLLLTTVLWPDEIRKPEFGFLDQDVEVRPQELSMAASLIESMAGSFDPNEFTDDYTDAMRELIEAKASGAELPERPEPEETGEVVDLMSALQRSVEAAKSSRDKEKPAAKKAPAKKAPAKKTATKSTAKKTGSKRTA